MSMFEYGEAILCFDKILEIKQDDTDALIGRGESLNGLERLDEAIDSFNKSISINNEDDRSWAGKANSFYYAKRFNDAIKSSEKALEINDENIQAWLYRGAALVELENFEEAVKALDRVIELAPEHSMAWFYRGDALHCLFKYDDAISSLNKSIEIYSEYGVSWNAKGCVLYYQKNFEDALKSYNKAIELEPNEPIFLQNKGEVLFDLGRYEESLDSYCRSIQLAPEDSESWNGKAISLKALGHDKEAEEAFRNAKRLEIKNSIVEQLKPAMLPQIIRDIKSVLERKGQIILYGPPGTGKTFWALKAAQELAANSQHGMSFDNLAEDKKHIILGSVVKMCSFHPAYGYEDFIEGYKPDIEGDNQLSFILKDGIIKELCRDAEANPTINYYLIIDEINRGDIPRIFGELMTVLEKNKRNKSVILPLSGKHLKVPKNIYLIGTMNTADRSVALLDSALRRRFGFIELMPNIDLLKDTNLRGIDLGRWLKSLNKRICENLGSDARNRQIGHSYLLEDGKPISEFSKFAEVVLDEIMPLVEEYCYEDYSKMGMIFGTDLIDFEKQIIRHGLFKEDNHESLAKALRDIISEESISGAGQ